MPFLGRHDDWRYHSEAPPKWGIRQPNLSQSSWLLVGSPGKSNETFKTEHMGEISNIFILIVILASTECDLKS